MFDAFVRTDDYAEGLRIGLSLVAALTHEMGASVSLTDRPGGGPRFVVELPAAQTPV